MKTIVYILIAGALGAMSRYTVGLIFSSDYSILAINLIGSFALAIVFDWLGELSIISKEFCGALATGFIGAFTTFSAITLNNVTYITNGYYGTAIIHILICVFGGLGLSFLGILLSKKLVMRRRIAS